MISYFYNLNQTHKKAIVIGSGIAGIAAALRLRKQGYEIDVYESNTYPGGKLTAIEENGFRFDKGPSLFTMPQFVDELYAIYGVDPREYYTYKRKDKVCNYFWEDGTRFQVAGNRDQFAKDAATAFGEREENISAYLASGQKKYELTSDLFLESSLHKWQTYTSTKTVKALLSVPKLDINKSLNHLNEMNFEEPKLIQLFNRYATYNGSSPYKTPGIMSMIPHLEMYFGTYIPKGGLHAITTGLFKLAKEQGIHFHFGQNVEKIIVESKKAEGVVVNGKKIYADLVVSNMDVWSTYYKLLSEEKKPMRILNQERSSSALIFYWGVNHQFKELDLHNIFFSENYKEEFEYIFDKKSLYSDPTVYVNITAKDVPDDAPKGKENWFVMINAPGNVGQDWDTLIKKARKAILEKLSRILGEDISSLIEVERIMDPREIESSTSSHQGSLYGASSNSKYAAFLRHPNFSRSIKDLYFCGGSVHPGGGIPLCLQSAKIVSELVE